MLVNTESMQQNEKHVQFVSYSGKYPTLCSGVLVLEIDGQEFSFGYSHNAPDGSAPDFPPFWRTGGGCGFCGNVPNTWEGEWEIDGDWLPEQFHSFADEIDREFNENVDYGCCGGCI